MKNFKKVLALSIAALILLKNNAYATTNSSGEFNVMKIGLLAIAVLLIAVVLYLSYKNDSPSEIKPKKQKEPKMSRKDSLKEELAEKDNTYEVEDDESYEDDSIEPVTVGRDEDEISLFESVNNPDTVKEEKEEAVYEEEEEEEEVVGFITKANLDKEKKSNSSRFERYTPTKEDDDTVNDFFSMDDEEDNLKTDINILENSEEVEEDSTEDAEEYDYNYDFEEEEKSVSTSEGGTMVFDSSELNSKIDILNGSDDEEEVEEDSTEETEEDYNYDYDFDFDKEEKEEVVEEEKVKEEKEEEDLFAGVKEEPTEFVGFTTIKPKEKTRGGNSRFERPNYSKIEEDILNGNVKNEEDDGDSANDFLAQMAKNLGGEEVKTKAPKKTTTAKKSTTTTKKTTSSKKTTKK